MTGKLKRGVCASSSNQRELGIERSVVKQNYLAFIEYIKQTIENPLVDMSTLGNWDSMDRFSYFKRTPLSVQLAKEFLTAFWSESKQRDATVLNQEQKFRLKSQHGDKKALYPSTISFMILKINGEQFCLVALSSDFYKNNVFLALKNFIDAFNALKKGIEFALLTGALGEFITILRELNGYDVTKLSCTELKYSKFLSKAYMRLGKRIQVEGVSNCSFYPFQNDTLYGVSAENSKLKSVIKPIANQLALFDETSTYLIDWCANCQKNKPSVARILKSAQSYTEDSKRNFSDNYKRELSPVRRNFASKSNLAKFFPEGRFVIKCLHLYLKTF